MIKYLLVLLIFLFGCFPASFSQKLKVKVEGKNGFLPQIFSINRNDTIVLSTINDSLFFIKDNYVGKRMLIKVGSVFMDIGLLDKEAKSIKVIFNPQAEDGCVIINKVYGDVIQSNLDEHLLKCIDFHEVKIYSTEDFSNDLDPVKVRRIKN